MKRSFKNLICSFLFCLVAAFFVIPSVKTEAASKPSCDTKRTQYVMQAASSTGGMTIVWDQYKKGMTGEKLNIQINNLASNAKIKNVKSSNTKVLKATAGKKKIKIAFKGFGTSNVTFDVKQNGKTYHLSCRYTFKKTPTPFKLKVGSKDISSKLKGRNSNTYKTGKKSVKISVTPKSNVEIVNIRYAKANSKGVPGKEHTLKNKSTLDIPKNGVYVYISYRYKNGTYGVEGYSNADVRTIYLKR